MGVTITPDRIRLTDASGNTKFDTNEELFTATDYVAGTLSMAARTADANDARRNNVNVSTTYTLKTGLNANATTVLGLVRTNWSFAGSGFDFGSGSVTYPGVQVGGTRWRNANASIVDVAIFHMSHHSEVGVGVFDSAPGYIQGISVYTLRVSGGTLYLDEQIMLQAFTTSLSGESHTMTRGAGTFDYRVYCGLFV